MSDVGDVNNAHTKDPEDANLRAYVAVARKIVAGKTTFADELVFSTLHNPANVAKLGDIIDRLRAENAAVLDKFLLDTEE